MNNLYSKTQHSQTQLGILFLSSISIIYKQLEDRNNKNKDFKAKIYYLLLKIML